MGYNMSDISHHLTIKCNSPQKKEVRGRLVPSLESYSLECDFRELKSRESDFVMFGIPRKC